MKLIPSFARETLARFGNTREYREHVVHYEKSVQERATREMGKEGDGSDTEFGVKKGDEERQERVDEVKQEKGKAKVRKM